MTEQERVPIVMAASLSRQLAWLTKPIQFWPQNGRDIMNDEFETNNRI
jgi:hypothetical protein